MRSRTFTTAAAVLALVGTLLAIVAPTALGAPAAVAGSVGASGILGTVFAAYSLDVVRRTGRPRLAPTVMTTLLGGWIAFVPLQYAGEPAGFTVVAVVQSLALLTVAFGGYTAIEAFELAAVGASLTETPDDDN